MWKSRGFRKPIVFMPYKSFVDSFKTELYAKNFQFWRQNFFENQKFPDLATSVDTNKSGTTEENQSSGGVPGAVEKSQSMPNPERRSGTTTPTNQQHDVQEVQEFIPGRQWMWKDPKSVPTNNSYSQLCSYTGRGLGLRFTVRYVQEIRVYPNTRLCTKHTVSAVSARDWNSRCPVCANSGITESGIKE